MGTLTLSEMRNEVRVGLGNRTDVTDARLTRALNLAQQRVSRTHTFEETRKLSTFTFAYTGVPADDKLQEFSDIDAGFDPKEVYSIRLSDDSNSRKLKFVDPRLWDSVLPDTDSNSVRRPEHYTRWKTSFEWYPVPDAAYSLVIRWAQWPTALAADGDLSILDHKDEILIFLSLSYIRTLDRHFEDAARMWNIARTQLEDAISMDNAVPDDQRKMDFGFSNQPMQSYWADPMVRSVR